MELITSTSLIIFLMSLLFVVPDSEARNKLMSASVISIVIWLATATIYSLLNNVFF